MDKIDLTTLEVIDYHPKYNEDYLNALIEKGSESWAKIDDKDAWLKEIRGSHE